MCFFHSFRELLDVENRHLLVFDRLHTTQNINWGWDDLQNFDVNLVLLRILILAGIYNMILKKNSLYDLQFHEKKFFSLFFVWNWKQKIITINIRFLNWIILTQNIVELFLDSLTHSWYKKTSPQNNFFSDIEKVTILFSWNFQCNKMGLWDTGHRSVATTDDLLNLGGCFKQLDNGQSWRTASPCHHTWLSSQQKIGCWNRCQV